LFQHTAREDSPIKVAAPPPKSKLTKGCQKRTTQNEDASRFTEWTNEEEITLCKGWVLGNAGRESGFWTEVLRYPKYKRKALGRQTPQANGARDEDYYVMTLLDYEVEHKIPFTLRHKKKSEMDGY
ncbi:hypothetical protein Tco_0224821, partial [Tanacetum coccineum]